jgi:hypothetical protein
MHLSVTQLSNAAPFELLHSARSLPFRSWLTVAWANATAGYWFQRQTRFRCFRRRRGSPNIEDGRLAPTGIHFSVVKYAFLGKAPLPETPHSHCPMHVAHPRARASVPRDLTGLSPALRPSLEHTDVVLPSRAPRSPSADHATTEDRRSEGCFPRVRPTRGPLLPASRKRVDRYGDVSALPPKYGDGMWEG